MATLERPIVDNVFTGAGYDYVDPSLHRDINLGTRDQYLMDRDYDLHRRGKLSKKDYKRMYGTKKDKGIHHHHGGHLGVDRSGYDNYGYGRIVEPAYGLGATRGLGYGAMPIMGTRDIGYGAMPLMGTRDIGYGAMPLSRDIGYGRDLGYGGYGGYGRDLGYGGMGMGRDLGYGGYGYESYPSGGMGMGGGLLGGIERGIERGIGGIERGLGMGGGMGMAPGMGGIGGMGLGGMGMGLGGRGPIDEGRFLKLPHYERISDNPNIDNATLWRPRADIFDVDQDHLRVEFELPGVPREDISLTIQDNILTLAALKPQTRKEEVGFHYQNERHFGKFYRRMMLPFSVDANKVKAHMDNGVLKVHLVRLPGVSGGRIPIGEGLLGTTTPLGTTSGSTLSSTTAPLGTTGTSTGVSTTRI
ncbi:Hsp20/alpha crystallin superfamily protein [Acanthamoeba castellanii str. Neff]|uniref:Hsp20/alpha crystallin superfamily protein n=1 Tax=Acanthamoeba castellanii (strain ATCC 30010 / Neff) TaxID=1257118 RepID=L8GZP5_ACACF|nr:Hsp20/alpha crystallin superfamily protein [Acanthamoeba castellanii str. Neff]ELR17993.1 Hsp20/alpha crystallin superfamily protein [Acanthamoeba castellanii str. Neff]